MLPLPPLELTVRGAADSGLETFTEWLAEVLAGIGYRAEHERGALGPADAPKIVLFEEITATEVP